MSKSLSLLVALLAACACASALADPMKRLGIGREVSPAEIAGWDIDVRPDGQGLPPGRGSVKDGEGVYMSHCAACHGEFGEGAGRWPPLAGGRRSLASHDPNPTVRSYLPHSSSGLHLLRPA